MRALDLITYVLQCPLPSHIFRFSFNITVCLYYKIYVCVFGKINIFIYLLDALHILAGSWNKVTKKTIGNCWMKANFFSAPEKQELEFETPISVPEGVAKEQSEK